MSHAASAIVNQLSPRDNAILLGLARHRFLNTRQIEQFFFYAHASSASASRSCRRVIERLYHGHFLVRLPGARQIGGWTAGSSSYVYSLSQRGYTAVPNVQQLKRPISRETTSPLFLDHSLEIANTHAALEAASRGGSLQLLGLQLEPLSWRTFSGAFGTQQTLKPDVYVVTANNPDSQYEDTWFLEVDRATMSSPVILRKCQQYISYRLSGDSRRETQAFPLVVWLVPHAGRYKQLRAVVASLPEIHQVIFRVMLQKNFVRFIKTRYFLEHLDIAGERPGIY